MPETSSSNHRFDKDTLQGPSVVRFMVSAVVHFEDGGAIFKSESGVEPSLTKNILRVCFACQLTF